MKKDRYKKKQLTSLIHNSPSMNCIPFCIIWIKAPGGIAAVLTFDWATWLSMPNEKAECWYPIIKRNYNKCKKEYVLSQNCKRW